MLFVFYFYDSGPNGNNQSSNGDRGDNGSKKDPEVIIDGSSNENQNVSNTALAQIGVPDNFPEVPILPVLRNPIFPKFVKLVEVRIFPYIFWYSILTKFICKENCLFFHQIILMLYPSHFH